MPDPEVALGGIRGGEPLVAFRRNTGPPAAASSLQAGVAVESKRLAWISMSSLSKPLPPVAGTSWHATQETLLNSGPRPVAGVRAPLLGVEGVEDGEEGH